MTLRTASCPRALFRLGLAARLDPPGDDPLDRLRRPPAFSSSVPATFRGSDATGAIPGSSPLPGKCPPGPPTPCAYPWCSGPLRAHQHPAPTPGAPGPSGPTNTLSDAESPSARRPLMGAAVRLCARSGERRRGKAATVQVRGSALSVTRPRCESFVFAPRLGFDPFVCSERSGLTRRGQLRATRRLPGARGRHTLHAGLHIENRHS